MRRLWRDILVSIVVHRVGCEVEGLVELLRRYVVLISTIRMGIILLNTCIVFAMIVYLYKVCFFFANVQSRYENTVLSFVNAVLYTIFFILKFEQNVVL